MVTTSGRTRGRQSARSGAPGPAAEHRSKIIAALASGVIVIVLVLAMTSQGRAIDTAVQHFMLYYAGVFALIALTTAVGVGLVATDRIILKPGHRVMAQAIHRAVSFGALAFLVIHIMTEILAQRVHVIDSVVPFLSPFRTFYIGLGTIASDLIVLLVITSILRKRFTAHGKAWRWRAIHYAAYLSFVFGVLHGLMGGRSGKAYVDWGYGFAIALTALGIAVRFFALSQRKREELSGPPAGRNGGTSPLHAAALTMAQAQLGGSIQALPTSTAPWSATSLPAYAGSDFELATGYGYGGFTPLGAPPYGDDVAAYPYQQPALASMPAPSADGRQPLYEPGYVGPPRYQGAPRYDGPPAGGPGPVRRALAAPVPNVDSGPMPRLGTGPMPRAATGPMPRLDQGMHAAPGQPPRGGTGPMPAMGTGPMPVTPGQVPGMGSGQRPRGATGPMPAAGPMPTAGPMPAARPGPGTGPMPRAATGPLPRVDPGPPPRAGTGPLRSPAPDAGRRRRPPGEPREGYRSRHGGGAAR